MVASTRVASKFELDPSSKPNFGAMRIGLSPRYMVFQDESAILDNRIPASQIGSKTDGFDGSKFPSLSNNPSRQLIAIIFSMSKKTNYVILQSVA